MVLAQNRSATVLARSRTLTEQGNCGLARNKSAALSTSVKAADCKNVAAAHCRDYCYRPAYHVAFAAAARSSGRYCWNSLADCSWVWKTAIPGHWARRIARRRAPKAADSCRCLGPIARENSPAGASFQNLPADGHDRLHFPALPMSVWRCVANRDCRLAPRNCGSNYSWTKAAGYSKVPAVGSSFRRTARNCRNDRSLPARYALGRWPCRCALESTLRY
jgi:hypothetical protein